MKSFSSNSSIGIDVADRTIELVVMKKSGKKLSVTGTGRITMPEGVVENGLIVDGDALRQAVQTVAQQAGVEDLAGANVFAALPESQVYLQTFRVALPIEGNLHDALLPVIEKALPISREELIFEYQVQEKTAEHVQVLVVAASNVAISEWATFYEAMGISMDYFDVDMFATARAILADQKGKVPTQYDRKQAPESVEALTMIIDMGAETTTMACFDSRGLRYEHVSHHAGEQLTEALANELGVSASEAEEKKHGMKITDLKGAARKHILSVIGDIRTAVTFVEKKRNRRVGDVVLVGGASLSPGWPALIKKTMNKSSRYGESPYVKQQGFQFLQAVGLALRGVIKGADNRDPMLPAKGLVTQAPLLQKKVGQMYGNTKRKKGKKRMYYIAIAVLVLCVVISTFYVVRLFT